MALLRHGLTNGLYKCTITPFDILYSPASLIGKTKDVSRRVESQVPNYARVRRKSAGVKKITQKGRFIE